MVLDGPSTTLFEMLGSKVILKLSESGPFLFGNLFDPSASRLFGARYVPLAVHEKLKFFRGQPPIFNPNMETASGSRRVSPTKIVISAGAAPRRASLNLQVLNAHFLHLFGCY